MAPEKYAHDHSDWYTEYSYECSGQPNSKGRMVKISNSNSTASFTVLFKNGAEFHLNFYDIRRNSAKKWGGVNHVNLNRTASGKIKSFSFDTAVGECVGTAI